MGPQDELPDGPTEPGPPPLPDVPAVPVGSLAVGSLADRATVGPAPRARRGSRLGALLLVVLAAAAGFVGGLAASDVVTVPDALRSRAALEAERDAALIGLLEDILRTEGVMLAFNDEVGERLAGANDEATALAAIATAANDGVDALRLLRPLIVGHGGGTTVDAVRTVYLPHLDAWIDYLAALAERPAVLFGQDEQQPYILLINATADEFREALEELLARGPSPRAADLAERILDDGFRSEGPEPSV